MGRIESALVDIDRLDMMGRDDSPVHRIDARAKVVATAAFIITVVSHSPYDVSPLMPFAVFPLFMAALGGIPVGFVLAKAAYVLPFAVLVGMFNPLIDTEPVMRIGGIMISGGWISLASIILRALLCAFAALVLIATTGFIDICRALSRLGMPTVFAVQLLFVYRYIFVLVREGGRMVRARSLRSFGRQGTGVAASASLIGTLLVRTWDRAQRIHLAMLSRGFSGTLRTGRERVFGVKDALFAASWVTVFVVLRTVPLSSIIGTFIIGAFS